MSALDIEKEREQFAEWHLKEFGYWPRETDLYGHVFNVWLAAKRATQPAPSVPAQAGTAYSAGELELARLAAEHFGRPARDIPALAAFERHRAEQVKVPGMPGLSGAIPNFIAGYRAKAAETKSAGTVSGGDGPLPPLPRPRCTYADHSYPAFNRSQMLDYARAAIAAAGQGERVNVRDFMTAEQRADVDSGNPVLDHTDALQRAMNWAAGQGGGDARPIVTAPQGEWVLFWWIGAPDKKKESSGWVLGMLGQLRGEDGVWDGERHRPIEWFTHWRPLPPAPRSAAIAAKDSTHG